MTTELHERPASDWEHSHALDEGDKLTDTQYGSGPFVVEAVHEDGSVTLRGTDHDDIETHLENEINGALADGAFERVSDGLSHELATY